MNAAVLRRAGGAANDVDDTGAPRHADARVARVVSMFEQLTRADVARLGEIYRDDAHFKDPFNEVRGLAEVQRIFTHMFDDLVDPRFLVHDIVADADQCFLTWDFVFALRRLREGELRVRGATHLRFDAQGRIEAHRDYWDAAEELYEQLPGIGALMRWLKRRVNG